MAIQTTETTVSYLGDGVTNLFPFPYAFDSASDLIVGLNGTVQVSGYTVTGAGNANGGVVQFTTPPDVNVKVGIVRIPNPTQLTEFINGMLLAGSVDDALDKLTMMVQWLYHSMYRCVRFSDYDSDTSTLPFSTSRASKLLGFDDSGAPTLFSTDSLGIAGGDTMTLAISTTAQAQAGTDDSTAMSPLKVAQAVSYRMADVSAAQNGTDSYTIMSPVTVAASIAWRISQAIATQTAAQDGTDNSTIMSPLRVMQAITYRQSTQTQATTGTDNTTLMTPLRTAQAIAALAPTGGTALSISTTLQAQAGTDDSTAMSPLKFVQALAYRIATNSQAQAGTDDTSMMTALKTFTAITARISNSTQANAGTDNTTIMTPLMVWTAMAAKMTATAATQAQATAGTDNTTWMSPLRVAQAIAALASGGTNYVNAITAYSPTSSADNGFAVFIPNGLATTTVANANALASPYWGPGRLQTADGIKHGRFLFAQNAAVASPGNWDTIDGAFTGGLGKSLFMIEHRITGAATMTQPTSGYVFVPTTSAMFLYTKNTSGWNNATNGNEGRTGAASFFIKADNYGQGDLSGITISGLAVGTKAGSTDFLANPAIVLINGGCNAGSDGVYFNPREWNHNDGGHDVACIGDVLNLGRTNATGAKSVFWTGYRVQSYGTAAVDSIMSATGLFMYGIDLSMLNLTFTSGIALALKANQKIAFDCDDAASGNLKRGWRATSGGGYAITYNPSNPALVFAAGGNPVLQLGPTNVIINSALKHTGTTVGFMNANPIGVYSGWGTPTNYAQVANFPGSSATLAQCGQVIGVLIYWLKLIGLFSA